MPKTLAEQIAAKCKHFNGTASKTCRAGVDYLSVRVPAPAGSKVGVLFPCMKDWMGSGHTCADDVCPKREFRTAAEVEAEEEEYHKMFTGSMSARAAVVADAKARGFVFPVPSEFPDGKDRDAGGLIDCPVCGKTACLRYRISGYNGHVHAACGTTDCVRWME